MAKKPLVKEIIERIHWSQWLVDSRIACEVPPEIEEMATPEEAWKKADKEHIRTVCAAFEIRIPFLSADEELGLDDDGYDWKKFYKKYPKPPKKIMNSIKKWLKARD